MRRQRSFPGFFKKGAPAVFFLCAAMATVPGRGKSGPAAGADLMIGAKIYEYAGRLPELFKAWGEAGINTAFVSAALEADPAFRQGARAAGITTFIIFPVFFDPDELARRPELYAVTDKGTRAEEDWVKFVCPTREDYRRAKVAALRKLVKDTDPEGISLDFIRFFVFWEMVAPDRTPESLPNACFDPSCLEAFEKASGVKVPPTLITTADRARWILARHHKEWTEWKCDVIADMVGILADEARRIKPGIKINVHTVAWRTEDFGGALKAIAGQDLAKIARHTDYVSPMCYHHMVRQTPAWIHSVVEDVWRASRSSVIPSIQVKEAYIPGPETPAEFRQALVEALKPPSRGVVFWNWVTLAESPEKLAAVKAVLKSSR